MTCSVALLWFLPIVIPETETTSSEVLQGCSIFHGQSYSSEVWILLWVHPVLDLTSNFNLLSLLSIQYNYQQKLGKCDGFEKKCLRTDNWSVWITLPRSKGWAVKVWYFRRCGIFCVGKASTCLAALTWSTLSCWNSPCKKGNTCAVPCFSCKVFSLLHHASILLLQWGWLQAPQGRRKSAAHPEVMYLGRKNWNSGI